jgi:hypothetical protein
VPFPLDCLSWRSKGYSQRFLALGWNQADLDQNGAACIPTFAGLAIRVDVCDMLRGDSVVVGDSLRRHLNRSFESEEKDEYVTKRVWGRSDSPKGIIHRRGDSDRAGVGYTKSAP